MMILKNKYKKSGGNVTFSPNDIFFTKLYLLGSYIYIGPGAIFLASESEIVVGGKDIFGPRVTIMGGDHNASEIGRYYV